MNISIFSSSLSEERWVDQIKKELKIDIDIPYCVFGVPKSLSDAKPEAYVPQRIGLGPYHSLRPELYQMGKQKIAAVKKFLQPELLHDFEELVVYKLKSIEPSIRACYNKYLDLDCDTLAWMMAIDGIYLLQFLSTYECCNTGNEVDPAFGALTKDMVMLENQIPVIVLKEIQKALDFPDCEIDRDFSSRCLSFCRANSPLKLTEQSIFEFEDTNSVHLLAHMYHLIVNNRGIHHSHPMRKRFDWANDALDATKVFGELGVGGSSVQKHVMFLNSLPWQRILALLDNGDQPDENKIEEIGIPSVSQLSAIAKIKFKLTNGGIRDMKYDEGERTFYLPLITLDSNSDVVLRNLLAYEAAATKPGLSLELTEYVDLMCGIVDSAKDVDLLRKEGIILGILTDEEIAELFNGINQSTMKPGMKNELKETIDKVNEDFGNTRTVKVWWFIKNHLIPSEKFLKIFVAIVLLLLLTLQSFCQVYGCSTHWFLKISPSAIFLDKINYI